jgi:MFS family permease
MGLIGMLGSLGMAMGPAIGGIVTREYGINTMFYLSSVCGFTAAAIVISMKETLTTKRNFHPSMLKIRRKDLFEPRVILPAIIMGLAMFAYGAMLTLIADIGEHVGIHKKELLFTCFTITSLAIRLVAGKASDKYGRVPVMVFSCVVIMISMLLIAISQTQTMLIVAVCLYGFGQGSVSPTLLAWAADLSEERHKGRALASLYIFMELGIGVGAFASGWMYGHGADFFMPFVTCSVLAGIAFITLLLKPLLRKG